MGMWDDGDVGCGMWEWGRGIGCVSLCVAKRSQHELMVYSYMHDYSSNSSRCRQTSTNTPYTYITTHPTTIPSSSQVVSEELGHKLDKVDLSMLGQAKKISITKDDTIILHGGGTKEALQERIDQIQDAIAQATSDYDRYDCVGEGEVQHIPSMVIPTHHTNCLCSYSTSTTSTLTSPQPHHNHTTT